MRKPQQKRKASSSLGGNCGEDVIGDDGEPAAAAKEEAAVPTATSAPVAATSLVPPVSIWEGGVQCYLVPASANEIYVCHVEIL